MKDDNSSFVITIHWTFLLFLFIVVKIIIFLLYNKTCGLNFVFIYFFFFYKIWIRFWILLFFYNIIISNHSCEVVIKWKNLISKKIKMYCFAKLDNVLVINIELRVREESKLNWQIDFFRLCKGFHFYFFVVVIFVMTIWRS